MTVGEWPDTLEVQALLEAGWRPTPFRQFVLKLHSRCNLACDYCYMYEMADQSWRRQPRRMSRATLDRVADRIAEHARSNGLHRIEVILHGGEPLLAGAEHLRYAVTTIRSALNSETTAVFHIQTNGVMLDSVFLSLFAELGVFVSVSLDGDEEGHDLHRRRSNGLGSHSDVSTGLQKLTAPAFRHLFSGLLSTIDLRNDPVTTYEALLAHGPPAMDFLLPHGNWDTPPPGRGPGPGAPYGDWLIAVFERWYRAPARETRVRLFSEIIRLLLGRPSNSESIGVSPVVVAVDVPDKAAVADPDRGLDPSALGEVRVTGSVRLAKAAAVHVDADDAEADVTAAAEALEAADGGDDDAQFVVDGAEDHELLWYATQEIPNLVGQPD